MAIRSMRNRLGKLEEQLSEQRPLLAVTMKFLDLGGRLVCARLSDGRMVGVEEAEGLPFIPWCQALSGVDPFVVTGQRTEPDPVFRRE